MKHIWSILCQNSIIDSETNTISLYNSLEEIKINIDKSKMPADEQIKLPIEYDVVSFWIDEDDDINKERKFYTEVELLDPNKKIISSTSTEYIMKKGIKRVRGRIKNKGLKITIEGRYWFKVKMKEKKSDKFKEVAEVPLDIIISYKILDSKK